MPFTTATVQRIERGARQFQGVYSEMWTVRVTADPSSVAAGAEDSQTFTVPGLALGDMVIGWAAGVNITADADIEVYVSAANTLTVRISNLNGSTALDLGSSTWRFLVGRPNW